MQSRYTTIYHVTLTSYKASTGGGLTVTLAKEDCFSKNN